MKKQIAIVTITFFIVGFTAGISQAGAARRHTIEGALIGAGAVILGSAIINNMNRPAPAPVVRYETRHVKKVHWKGHWETRKICHRGKWVKGRYKERVWVRYGKGHRRF